MGKKEAYKEKELAVFAGSFYPGRYLLFTLRDIL